VVRKINRRKRNIIEKRIRSKRVQTRMKLRIIKMMIKLKKQQIPRKLRKAKRWKNQREKM